MTSDLKLVGPLPDPSNSRYRATTPELNRCFGASWHLVLGALFRSEDTVCRDLG